MRDDPPSNHNPLITLSNLGLPTFPLPRGGKRPKVSGFFEMASVVPDFDPALNNIGVATGGDFIVLDFDVKPDLKIDARPTLAVWDMMGLPHGLRVTTPSGGVHVYLALPAGHPPVSNSQSQLAPGVDVRGTRGYVVGPGSHTDRGTYEILGTIPDRLAPAPEFILRQLTRPRASTNDGPVIELDTKPQLEAAIAYLRDAAPIAPSDSGITYKVACRVKDLGVSEAMCGDLMLAHWNEDKADPTWDEPGLREKVARAYTYGTSAPGEKAPAAEFTDALTPEQLAAIEASRLQHRRPAYEDQPDQSPTKALGDYLRPLPAFDVATDVKPREPVLGTFLYKRFVTALISPPGVGKTTFGLQVALSIATARPLLGQRYAPRLPPSPAFYWTQEDDLDEIRLRLTAAMRHAGITWQDTLDDHGRSRLHLCSGVERPLAMAVLGSDRRTVLPSQDAADVLRYIEAHGIVSAFFDPLTELHPADENDNGQVGKVARVFRTIAVRANAAVCIVHHTRKPNGADASGSAGDMNSGRGASALMGVARRASTMYALDKDCAKLFGIPEADRHGYVRLDDAKSNISLVSGAPDLFRRVSVPIVETGDEVGVLAPVERVARESAEVGAAEFAGDVRFVVSAMLERGVKAVGWAQVSDALMRDEYEGGGGAPGKYAMKAERALEKAVSRLFDSESGAPVTPVLDGFEAPDTNGKGRYIRKREGA